MALGLSVFPLGSLLAQDGKFQSSSTVEQVREQINKLPKGDIWWSVNGENMGWNVRNLQRISPTVMVNRTGQRLLVNPKGDLVAVYTGYFKDDEHSELSVLPRLRDVLKIVYPADLTAGSQPR